MAQSGPLMADQRCPPALSSRSIQSNGDEAELPVLPRATVLHLQRILFLVPRHDAEGSIRQRPLKCLRLGPGRRQPVSPHSGTSVRIAGMAFGGTAPTSAFGSVVSSP